MFHCYNFASRSPILYGKACNHVGQATNLYSHEGHKCNCQDHTGLLKTINIFKNLLRSISFKTIPNAPFTFQVVRPMVRSFTKSRNRLPGPPHFIRVVHTKVSVICGYRLLAKCPCPLATVNSPYDTESI